LKRGALIALALCILAALIGGAGLWRSATIVADTTPPEIRQTRPRDGESFTVSGQLTVKCWVYENIELDSVKCTIYSKTLFGWRPSPSASKRSSRTMSTSIREPSAAAYRNPRLQAAQVHRAPAAQSP